MFKIKEKTIIYISFLLILFFYNSVLANSNENIDIKIKKCAACHTYTGNSLNPIWPKLAGQHSEYLFKQMIEYKKGKNGYRYDPIMIGMLQDLDENDMIQISEYFAKQILEKSKVKANDSSLIYGKKLYLYGDKENNVTACVGCHSIDGTGNKLANFPSLKWQHKDYIIIQLKKFKTHDRSNDVNSIMRDISTNMSDEQMDALATYISCIE